MWKVSYIRLSSGMSSRKLINMGTWASNKTEASPQMCFTAFESIMSIRELMSDCTGQSTVLAWMRISYTDCELFLARYCEPSRTHAEITM